MYDKIKSLFDIKADMETTSEIHSLIEANAHFRGTSLWILAFATVIASVGLNINATAVIIGAMLISPLMGPINAIGYSISTQDFPLLRRAAKNTAFAVSASLIASTVYFMITPVSIAHSELLARTSPTIYDVIIAFFGGLAGIVAIVSKNKGNVIPGVAIATALMPPLCTAGYGLGTFQIGYFFGAIYLFMINFVFIAIASMLATRAFKFPVKTILDPARSIKIRRIVIVVIILTMLPSLYFSYLLIEKEKFIYNTKRFTQSIGTYKDSYLIKSEEDFTNKKIRLFFGGNAVPASGKQILQERAKGYGLSGVTLVFEEGLTLDYLRNNLQADVRKPVNDQMLLLLEEKSKSLDSMIAIPQTGSVLLKELRVFYPQITSCTFGKSLSYSVEGADYKTTDAVVVILGEGERKLSIAEKQKIELWLKERFSIPDVLVSYIAAVKRH